MKPRVRRWAGGLVLLWLTSTACGGDPKVGGIAAGGNGGQSASTDAGGDAGTVCDDPNAVAYQSIATGNNHTCAVTTAGGLRCWGDNGHGQLGDDTTVGRSTPQVDDILTGVKAVSLGDDYSCALLTTGGVRCWGVGPLGLEQSAVPILSAPLVNIIDDAQSIAANAGHMCAITTSGGLRCWGDNSYGQLGDGTTTSRLTPPDSDDLTGVQAVTVGSDFTCALIRTDGVVRCWGGCAVSPMDCAWGVKKLNPPIDLFTGATAIAANAFDDVCALMLNGDLECFQQGTTNLVLSSVSAIAGRGGLYCALMQTGGVRCWGDYMWGTNSSGEPGSGFINSSQVPPATDLLVGATAVSVGTGHACAITTTGGAQCWGNGEFGKLGDGTGANPTIQMQPPASDVPTDAKAIAVGDYHTCVLTRDGGVRCWGRGVAGQLGDGVELYREAPPASDVITNVEAITAGSHHTCALTVDGNVRCWGSNQFGQLGDGSTTDRASPPTSDILTNVQAIIASGTRTCALMTSGGVRCWGDGTLSPPTEDVIADAKAIAVGRSHTCVLLNSGSVRCWGDNSQGQLGDGTRASTSAPTATDVLTGVQAISSGPTYTCALMITGSVLCWGTSHQGGYSVNTTYPYVVSLVPSSDLIPDTDVQAISAGALIACVLTNSGTVNCTQGISTEVTGAQAVAAGAGHTCALMTSGGVRCWGDGFQGQLGDGSIGYRVDPTRVTGTCR